MKQEYIAVIKVVNKFLKQGEEPDTSMIAKETSFTSQQVYDLITGMEEKGLLIAFEIDMCCGEDYVVKELTEKEKAML